MDRSFILKNQSGHYWGRSKEWVDGSDRSRVAQYKHRDEASNTVFELSSKDFGLRAEILEMQLKDGKLPRLSVSQIALPGLEGDNDEAVEAGNAQSEDPGEESGSESDTAESFDASKTVADEAQDTQNAE